MNIGKKKSKDGSKTLYFYDYGRGKGQRPSTGIFTYNNPKTQSEKNHNKESLKILEIKRSEQIIETQAAGSSYIPQHRFKANFFDYYEEFVELNKRDGNRHLMNSLKQFRIFWGKPSISTLDITPNLCERFRTHLLDKFTGETPLNYYTRFKKVITAATEVGYFQKNPVLNISSKTNPSKKLKDFLEVEEYLAILKKPCLDEEVRDAFIFCLYTGLRWVDVNKLHWSDINEDQMIKRLVQSKTGHPVAITLHEIALNVIKKLRRRKFMLQRSGEFVFELPSAEYANKVLKDWVKSAGAKKEITWSCARLSFSILLQDQRVDDATVAFLMGHKTTEQVQTTYKRHRPKNQMETVQRLPAPDTLPLDLLPDAI